MLAELSEVPAGAAEDADGRKNTVSVRSVRGGEGVEFAVHGADEGGFSAAVGAEDGEVFAGADGEVDVVEDDAVAEGDVDVAHDEEVGLGVGVGGHFIC
jgi:hypothetical protein